MQNKYMFNLLKNVKRYGQVLALSVPFFVFEACTTYSPQYGKRVVNPVERVDSSQELSHRFYLIGDAGNAEEEEVKQSMEFFRKRIQEADSNATLIFLGDNVYPKGIPNHSQGEKRKLAEEKLNLQLEIAKEFKGKTIFINGNHDWYSGIEGVEEQVKLVTTALNDTKSFLPRNNCGLERMKINKEVILLVIDSQWFLENWDDYPTMNDDCTLKTREEFFDELKSELNKFQNETVIIALHHPVVSNSSHGGQLWSWEQQLHPVGKIPLPILGTLMNLFRKSMGIPQDIQSKPYRELANRIMTLVNQNQNVILISGHEHNLQYIEQGKIKQIISGAGSKNDRARALNDFDFSFGGFGYAVLDVYKDTSAWVRFFATDWGEERLLFAKQIQEPQDLSQLPVYPEVKDTQFTGSIYPAELIPKGAFYNWLMGKKYRDYYGKSITAPVLNLETLGLKPLRAGGGMQSNSLRLIDEQGKEYSMRSLKKNTTRFLQSLYPEQYMMEDFENTGVTQFLYDFYTSSHPFYPLVVQELSKPLDIYHTQPKLFYVPKQNALGKYNADYGDEFYLLEERPMQEHAKAENFGGGDDIISTLDLLKNLHKDEKYKVDEKAFIRARIFDMLLGDWDRHQDQWRWTEFKKGDSVIYRPVPRDRDQVFARYDGVLLKLLLNIPAVRHFSHFDDEPKSLKWLNKSGYPLDIAFIREAEEKDWGEQAKYIQENLTDEVIEKAFQKLPIDEQDAITREIIANLKIRREKLKDWAKERYRFLQKRVILTGTDKKDRFTIHRLEEGKTEIIYHRLKKTGEELISHRIYSPELTQEIWIYGLDDEDEFVVEGDASAKIKIRIIGGQNNDVYRIENGQKLIVYDYKSKKNKIENPGGAKIRLTDDYEINNYDFYKSKYNVFFGYPSLGYNPDDGVKIGADLSYQINGFVQSPFTQNHRLKGMYYFATNGFELEYEGDFAEIFQNWNLNLKAKLTSPNFSINYFGYGNETENLDDIFGMNYNRVKIENWSFNPSLIRDGRYGSVVELGLNFERSKVKETIDRFVRQSPEIDPSVFHSKTFGTLYAAYSYENYDFKSFPTLGFTFGLKTSYTMNLEETGRCFTQLETHLGFTQKLLPSGILVFSTLWKGNFIWGNDFEFYQGVTLGGTEGLRGFRNERFLGDKSYFQTSDLRLRLGSIRGLIPMKYGILGGFDYGRVWLKGEDSQKWHNSYGAGFWLNAAELTSLHINYFHSDDGNRFTFGIGFNF